MTHAPVHAEPSAHAHCAVARLFLVPGHARACRLLRLLSLALAVSAGEGATGALDRVCRLSRGELSAELGACLAEARAGANLPTALQGLADRTGLTSLSRFVDGIVVAAERGTPLAEVLRAQAQDVRESGRRAVMEEGGRKEIAMMVPNVNLYLSNSPGRAAQEEADNMSQMERTIRGTIAWKFAPIGDAIPRRRAQDPRRGAHRG